MVAMLDKSDQYHQACVSALGRLAGGPLLTTWPCFTETMYLLGQTGGHRFQSGLWDWRRDGRLLLIDVTHSEANRMDALMAQYRDVPMDLADASLLAVAESRG